MIPFVAFCFLSKPIHLTGSGSGSMKNATAAGVMSPQRGVDQRVVDASTLVATPRSPASPSAAPPEAAPPAATLGLVAQRFCVDVAEVLRQPVFVSTCFGYTLYVAVLGAYAFWGPQAGKAIFFGVHDHSATPDLVFGGVTLLTGVLGSVIGGAALDRCGSTNRNASLLCAGCVLVGFVLAVSAFMATRSFAAFMVVFGAAQLFLFMVQAPIAGLSMWCVPRALRPLAVSCITIVIHVLGDVPSPPLLGALQARLSRGKSEQGNRGRTVLHATQCDMYK